jgi:hypothetical protein
MRTSANLTKSEIAAYQAFCRTNRIALDGKDGEKNGALFAEVIGVKMNADFTEDTLETAFAQLQGKLKMVSRVYAAADDLARQMSADEQQIYRVWSKAQKFLVGLDGGTEEGYMNAKSLLEWTKGRGSAVTIHSLDLALGNIINNPQPGQRIHFHARPEQQDRSVVQGRVNHAFGQEETKPKAAAAGIQGQEFVNGRRNHAYVPPGEAAKSVTAAPVDAWQRIIEIQLKDWVTPSQEARLQNEYKAGVAAGKSLRDISTSLQGMIKDRQRGR